MGMGSQTSTLLWREELEEIKMDTGFSRYTGHYRMAHPVYFSSLPIRQFPMYKYHPPSYAAECHTSIQTEKVREGLKPRSRQTSSFTDADCGLSMLLQPFPVVLCVLFLCPPTPHSLDLSVCVLFVTPQNPLSSTRHPFKYMSNLTRWFCGLAVFIYLCSQMSLWDVLSPGASLFRRM